jgi:hypothetical protein
VLLDASHLYVNATTCSKPTGRHGKGENGRDDVCGATFTCMHGTESAYQTSSDCLGW